MKSPAIIAISGKSGCGNTTVSRLLAEKLGYGLVNYTFRNIAADQGLTLAQIIALAEEDYSYDRLVDAKQVELARAGERVIGSRLAIWMLPEAALRVYLTASVDARADRIRAREGGEKAAVLSFTRDRDAKDHDRYRRIYGIDNDDFSFADLVLNTESFRAEEEVDIIIRAYMIKCSHE